MKRFILTIFIISLDFTVLKAQNFTHDFGKYSAEEFKMGYYRKDASAEAVVIYDIGKSYFIVNDNDMLELIFERRTKIKIFNKSGIKWAEFSIPYYEEGNNAEQIFKIEGNTYNYENGQVRCTPLDIKNTYLEKVNKNWSNKKFAMPDVKEGSVIEVRYKISTPYFFNFRSWEFQSKIPVIYSEYTTKMIPFYSYQYIIQGTNKLDDLRQYVDTGIESTLGGVTWKDQVFVFVMKDIPAFNDEAFISSLDDYLIKIDFQLSEYTTLSGIKTEVMSNWNKLVKDVLNENSFGDYIESSESQAKGIIKTMGLESLTPKEKCQKVYEFVRGNYSWNETSSKFSSQKAKEFVKTKVGNSADINLFLIGMLRAAGIDANPLILSTRGHGKIKSKYPFQHFFNYVIATIQIDDKYITLDATEPLSSFGMVPPRCLNDKGLFIKKSKEVEWYNFSNNYDSSTEYYIDLRPKIDADSVEGTIKIMSSGYDGLNLRHHYYKNNRDLKNEVINNNQALLNSIEVQQLNEVDKPLIVVFKANASLDNLDNKVLIIPFFGYSISDNPLKQYGRTYPIDMSYRNQSKFISTIHIPEGYKILSKPEGMSIDNDDVKISYSLEMENDSTINLTGLYEFRKDVYDASKYLELKMYFNKIIDKFNEKIILVKI